MTKKILIILFFSCNAISSLYAQFNMGEPLQPKPGQDYQISSAIHIKGGHHQVATIAERNAITGARRALGMLCTVENDGGEMKTFQLILNPTTVSTTAANWEEFSGAGGATATPTASQVQVITNANLVANNVQGALEELQGEILTNTTSTGNNTTAINNRVTESADDDYVPKMNGKDLENSPILVDGNNIGIGATPNASADLHIYDGGGPDNTAELRLEGNNGDALIQFTDNGVDQWQIRNDINAGVLGLNPLIISNGQTNSLFIDYVSGNVGIGTTTETPVNALDVNGSINATMAYLLNGEDLNAAGTLGNVAYLNQANVFTSNQRMNEPLNIYKANEQGDDPATLFLTSGDGSAEKDQVLSQISTSNKDNDGHHIASFIKTIASELYGRKSSMSFGVATELATDAVEVMRIDENGKIKGQANTPSSANDIVNKAYVDALEARINALIDAIDGTEPPDDGTTQTDYDPTAVPTLMVEGVDFQPVTSPQTGRVWMDRNLGAHRVALRIDDLWAYGNHYQWIRESDGHELTDWQTNTLAHYNNGGGYDINGTISGILQAATTGLGATFYTNDTGTFDWLSNGNELTNGNLWWDGTGAGTNNPCPAGYHVPTNTEWNAEDNWDNSADSYSSFLKLPAAGSRNRASGQTSTASLVGYYWASTVTGAFASRFVFGTNSCDLEENGRRAEGFSVRCIQDL